MWEPQQPSLWMVTQLLLLTSVLLPTCQVAESQALFTIRSVNLTLEPSNAVSQGTNVMVRCQALVSSSWLLNREYTIYKENTVVYTRSTTTTEDLLYSLCIAKVANTGKYECKVNIQGKELSSNSKNLTVTGLQMSVLSVDKRVFSKGEVTVWCKAPEESGAIVFYFYKYSKDLYESVHHTCHLCPTIIEGEDLDICSVIGNLQNSSGLKVYLSKGLILLSTGQSKANHSMRALAEHSGELESSLEMGNVKQATENVTITVPLSNPGVIITPDLSGVTEGDEMYLIYGVEGSLPVTSKWYRSGNMVAVHHLNPIQRAHQIKGGGNVHSGTYYCKAINYTTMVQSQPVTVDGSEGESTAVSNNEPDVEYTDVVHRQPVDPARVPLRKGTETVCSEVQNSPTSAPGDHYHYQGTPISAVTNRRSTRTCWRSITRTTVTWSKGYL